MEWLKRFLSGVCKVDKPEYGDYRKTLSSDGQNLR